MVAGVRLIPLSAVLPGAVLPGAALPRTDSRAAPRAGDDNLFVAGSENRMLATALETLLADPHSSYNPLVLFGPPGVGKSHLARGLVDTWKHLHGTPAVHSSGAEFARSYAAAVENQCVPAWRKLYRLAGLLVVEDLMQLSTKRTALQELMMTIDELINGDRQVIVTSRVAPGEIRGLPDALQSRLVGGLLLAVSPPGHGARRLLIERLARVRNLPIDATAIRLLADGLPGTVPELHAALCELQVAAVSETTPIDAQAVRQFLGQRTARLQPSLHGITSLTAKYFGLKVAELTSPSRRRAVVTARGVAMYLARQLTGKSLEQVGSHFGGRDHTTVLHSYRSTDQKLRRDPEVRRAVADLRKMLALS